MLELINYIPIVTTIFAVYFFIEIFRHYRSKPDRLYLLWWSIGVFTYGIGTLTESINAVAEWSLLNFKIWYISGALLGGYPLAQGSVYLLMKKKFADISSIIVASVIVIASICIALSPVTLPVGFDGELTGEIFTWSWVRTFTPFINIYAFIFLFGGAVYSAYWYAKNGHRESRFKGNIIIAIGALLPGIGGTFTRFGYVEVLFITELLGLVLIFWGYKIIRDNKNPSLHTNQKMAEGVPTQN